MLAPPGLGYCLSPPPGPGPHSQTPLPDSKLTHHQVDEAAQAVVAQAYHVDRIAPGLQEQFGAGFWYNAGSRQHRRHD